MPVLRCRPHDTGAPHILGLNPAAGRALVDFHSAVLRVDSQLTARSKESTAAHASGINACQYCHFVHKVTAEAFGVDKALIEFLLGDLGSAPVDAGLKPVLDPMQLPTMSHSVSRGDSTATASVNGKPVNVV